MRSDCAEQALARALRSDPVMGLTSALQIGRSALSASQVAIQVTGNNFANAATPGYSRQIVSFNAIPDARLGSVFVGRGVEVSAIRRQVDTALQARLWSGVSEEASASANYQVLSQVESTLNELTDNDLSSEFSRFFDAWSELANSPNREGARALVVNQGRTLASSIRSLRSDLIGVRNQVDSQLAATVDSANKLLQQIADVNAAVVQAEAGTGVSNSLRDQRDALIGQLSEFMDVSTVEQANGVIDVLVGSTPVVLAGQNRGIALKKTTAGSELNVSINVKDDGTQLSVRSGSIGALLGQRGSTIDRTIDRLDDVAAQLVFEVNKVHSQGFGQTPLTSLRSTRTVSTADTTLSLNDPSNLTFSALPFQATNGGFLVTVRNQSTGAEQTVRIDVDLDGRDSTGAPGFGDDTSVASLATDLDNLPSVSATVNPDGTLSITTDQGFDVRFSDDSSGVLAVLGINTYFTGKDATDIDVRSDLVTQPGLLATGGYKGTDVVDNAAALNIAALRDAKNPALSDRSISGAWIDTAQSVGLDAAAASNRADATRLVRENLESQRSAVSGVSVDEESINLLSFQRQYQASARFISAVDEMTQTLLSLI